MVHFAPCTFDVLLRLINLIIFVGVEYGVISLVFIPFYNLEGGLKVLYWVDLVLWSFFSLLWLIAHIQTSWLDAGSVAAQLEDMGYKTRDEYPQYIKEFPICGKCGLPKPERTHHCSDCNKCYFRFDHHCPFIGNCVALKNMKAFMLYLYYSGIVLILSGSSALFYLTKKDPTFTLMIWVIFVFSVLIGINTIAFGLSYVKNVCVNQTTLEGIAQMNPETYNNGRDDNFRQVFGESPWRWFLPIPIKVNGFEWAMSQRRSTV